MQYRPRHRAKRPPGYRRAWLVLFALVMPLALVFSNPVQATAATYHEVHVTFNDAYAFDTNCWTSVAYTGDGLGFQVTEGYCKGGPDTTPAYQQIPEPGTVITVTASGNSASLAVDCSGSYVTTTTAHAADGFAQTASTIPAGSATLLSSLGAPTGDCSVTTVCIEAYSDSGPGEATYEECVPVPMGVPDGGPQGECVVANAVSATAPTKTRSESGMREWVTGGTVTFDGMIGGYTWGYSWITRSDAGALEVTYDYVTSSTNELARGGFVDPGETVVGVQVHVSGDPQYGATSSAGYAALPPAGWLGTTDAGHCRWYFGEDLTDELFTGYDSGFQTDDPMPFGDGAADPAPTPPGDEDPTAEPTDDVGWLEGIFGLLAQLLGAIGRLASAIVSGILDGLGAVLSALFVPDEQKMKDFTESLSLDGTRGANWKQVTVDGLGSLDGGSGASVLARTEDGSSIMATGGGCQGPAFTWSKFETVGLDTTVHPFDACEGIRADLAYWSRLVLTVLIAVGGGIKALEMMFHAFGVANNVRIMSSFDWSSPDSGRLS